MTSIVRRAGDGGFEQKSREGLSEGFRVMQALTTTYSPQNNRRKGI